MRNYIPTALYFWIKDIIFILNLLLRPYWLITPDISNQDDEVCLTFFILVYYYSGPAKPNEIIKQEFTKRYIPTIQENTLIGFSLLSQVFLLLNLIKYFQSKLLDLYNFSFIMSSN